MAKTVDKSAVTVEDILLIFDKKEPKHKTGKLVMISVLSALAVGSRIAFYSFPQFKPTLAIVIIAGACMGAESGFIVGAVSAFVSNFLGHGPWTPWQMFAFAVVGLVSGILFQKGAIHKSRFSLSVYGFAWAIVIYGGIINPDRDQ